MLVPALVKDAEGGIVYGLQAADFLVEDNGVEQTVRLDEAPEGQPISLVVVVQRGRRAAAEFPRMQGLRTMLDPLFELGTARVAVIEFDSHVEITRNFTTDGSLVDDDLRNLQPGDNGVVILDAVKSAVNLLSQEPPERLRILLLISETRDHGSRTKNRRCCRGHRAKQCHRCTRSRFLPRFPISSTPAAAPTRTKCTKA